MVDIDNHGLDVLDTMMDVGNNHMGGYSKLSLQVGGEK